MSFQFIDVVSCFRKIKYIYIFMNTKTKTPQHKSRHNTINKNVKAKANRINNQTDKSGIWNMNDVRNALHYAHYSILKHHFYQFGNHNSFLPEMRVL